MAILYYNQEQAKLPLLGLITLLGFWAGRCSHLPIAPITTFSVLEGPMPEDSIFDDVLKPQPFLILISEEAVWPVPDYNRE